jgi:hypothetical protein
MNPVLEAMGRVHDENILIRSANKANLILTLMVIHDKFDFDREQCERFLEEYNKQLEAYNEGYVERVSDFEEVLKDELGIEIRL